MSEGWNGNEKRTTKEPPKVFRGGHRKPGGVVAKPKQDSAKKSP